MKKLRAEEQADYASNYKQQVNIAVSPDLYKAFKVKCAALGFSMTAVMTDSMLNFIDQRDDHSSPTTEGSWEGNAR